MSLDSMEFVLETIYIPDEIKDVAYVTNLVEYSDTGTRWVALYVNKKLRHTLIVLELNIFQVKSKEILIIKT